MSRRKDTSKESMRDYHIDLSLENLNRKPYNYTYCLKDDCPLAATCKHKVFYEQEGKEKYVISVFNPLVHHPEGDTCRHYVGMNETEIMARGFEHFVSCLDDETKKKFQRVCMNNFCKSVYYDLRAGNRLIYPAEQSLLMSYASKVGATLTTSGFDRTYIVPKW